MLENEVIELLCNWLRKNGWTIVSAATDRSRGDDIRAIKDARLMLVEAKGSRGNPKLPGVRRMEFDTAQIRDHLGKAIVKVIEMRIQEPKARLVIAHPSTDKILRLVVPVAKQLIALNIDFVFVGSDGSMQWIKAGEAIIAT